MIIKHYLLFKSTWTLVLRLLSHPQRWSTTFPHHSGKSIIFNISSTRQISIFAFKLPLREAFKSGRASNTNLSNRKQEHERRGAGTLAPTLRYYHFGESGEGLHLELRLLKINQCRFTAPWVLLNFDVLAINPCPRKGLASFSGQKIKIIGIREVTGSRNFFNKMEFECLLSNNFLMLFLLPTQIQVILLLYCYKKIEFSIDGSTLRHKNRKAFARKEPKSLP